jgi:hypothetical protein
LCSHHDAGNENELTQLPNQYAGRSTDRAASNNSENYMGTITSLSVAQLKQAIAIKEQIEGLQAQLESITGGSAVIPSETPGRRVMSASAKARIAAAQRRRWAKIRSGNAEPSSSKSAARRKVSPATRARLAAIARKRWAKAKASGKSAL